VPTGNTPPTQMRLTPETRAHLDRIAERYGLSSRTAAVALAAKLVADGVLTPATAPKKKSGKSSQ